MPVSRPSLVVSSLALLAALSLPPGNSFARDGRPGGSKAAQEVPVIGGDSADDIIFVMPPLKPVKGALAPVKAAPAVAEKNVPEPESAPQKSEEAQLPKPQEPIARAETGGDKASPEVAAEPAPPKIAADPIENTGAATQEAETLAAEPAPKPSKTAQRTKVSPAPEAMKLASLPTLTLNPPSQPLSRMKAPAFAADPVAAGVQTGNAQGLVPALAPVVAPAEPQLAAAEADVETPSAGPAPTEQPQTSQAEAPAAPVAAEPRMSEADARIEALLAQGVMGPAKIRLADRATMWLPAGRLFIPQEPARKLAAEVGLDLHPSADGLVTPAGDKLDWLATVEVVDDGHIKAEPGQLDSAKLLVAFEASLPQVNAQRAASGQSPVSLEGWLAEPALDGKHRLSACVNVATANDPAGADRFFNCEAWSLGRTGAVKVGVADDAELAERLKNEAGAISETIVFEPGKTYEDFDPAADKLAPYSAGDVLVHDVSPRQQAAQATPAAAEPAAAAPVEGEIRTEGSIFDEPLILALGGVILALLLIQIKRGREQKSVPSQAASARPAAPAPRQSPAPANEAVAPAAPSSPSLFARLLPTLHARFARKGSPAPHKAESPAAPTPKPAAESRSLVAKLLPTLHARVAKKGAPAPAAKPGNDADEPTVALKRIAALMKEPEPEPPVSASPVRRPRVVGGALLAATEEMEQPLVAAMASEAFVEDDAVARAAAPIASPPSFDASDLGLVEPGDEAAATAAINAARARRRTDG